MFCYQRKYNQQVQIIESIDELHNIMRSQEVRDRVAEARTYKAMGNDASYALAKKQLPLLIFSASDFDISHQKRKDGSEGPEGKWRTQATSHLNGLAVLDIDHVKNPKEIYDRIWKEHKDCFLWDDNNPYWKILFVFVTPSNEGAKFVFTADPKVGNIADNQIEFSKFLGLANDISIKDSSRGQFATTEDDVLYLDERVVSYYDPEFEAKYGSEYRNGNSAPTKQENKKKNENSNENNHQSNHESNQVNNVNEEELMYGSIPVRELAVRYSDRYGSPVEGDRHRSLIKVAGHLRYLVDNNPQKLKVALRALPWVREWEQKESNAREIDDIADEVCGYRMWRELPKALQSVLQGENTDVHRGVNAMEGSPSECAIRSDSEALADRLRPLLADDPVYATCCSHLSDGNKVAGVFAAGGMFATLATRVHYLHYDGEQHRMNPQVFIIGKPASGKSFADDFNKSIMAVLRAADEPGRAAERDFKKENNRRKTLPKGQKGDKPLDAPEVCIRNLPSRTSNAVFYKRQLNAKELVDGEILPLHLYMFDSELDSSVTAQSGGSWIGKHDLELKAFHNEFSGVDYANADSVNEVIQVFWNQVVTGTDVSLSKKINMRNVNDGLCSRIAICRMETKDYVMIDKGNYEEKKRINEAMKKWGERFDALKGEVYVPKLVDHCYKLCEKAAKAAQLEDDHVLDYFRKRAVFYAEWFTIIRVLGKAMQEHDKDEKVDIMKPKISQSDLDFAEFIFDTIVYYQDVFFGSMLEEVWQNATNAFVMRKQTKTSRNEKLFDALPMTFDRKQVQDLLGLAYGAAAQQCTRWLKQGMIKKVKQGVWQKIS